MLPSCWTATRGYRSPKQPCSPDRESTPTFWRSPWGFERGGDGCVVGWAARIWGMMHNQENVGRDGPLRTGARALPVRPVMPPVSVSRASGADGRGSAGTLADILGRCHELSMASGGGRAFGRQPASKTSTTIMGPPRQGQGRTPWRCSSGASPSSSSLVLEPRGTPISSRGR